MQTNTLSLFLGVTIACADLSACNDKEKTGDDKTPPTIDVITPVAGQTYALTACKKTGGATQTIVTHQTQSGTCNIVPGTLYYLFIRVNGACTTTGSSCNLLVADNFDFH